MIDLSLYNLTLGRTLEGAAEWFRPVLDRGRGAALIDTGFLRAMIDENDQYAFDARKYYDDSAPSTHFYTTSLVLAETVRQIAKGKPRGGHVDYAMRQRWFDQCSEILIDRTYVFVCHPPRELLISAYQELRATRQIMPSLDLCDALSVSVLDYAQHRRVFGFDGHFNTFGAQVEPLLTI